MPPSGEDGFQPTSDDKAALRKLFDLLDTDCSDKIERMELLQKLKQSNEAVRSVIAQSKWLRPMLHPKGFSLQQVLVRTGVEISPPVLKVLLSPPGFVKWTPTETAR